MKKLIASLLVLCIILAEYSIASSSAFQIRNGQSCTKNQVGNLTKFRGKTFLCVDTKYGKIWTAVNIPKQGGGTQSAVIPSKTTVAPTTTVASKASGAYTPITPSLACSLNPKYCLQNSPYIGNTTTTTESPLNASPVAGDLTGPVIVSASVVPNSVDVSDGPVSVLVTAIYVDASGMNTNLSWATFPNYISGTLPRISGDSRNGTYQKTFTIPQGSRPIVWDVTINGQGDVLGNIGQAMFVPFTIINRNWGVATSTATVP